MLKKIILIFIAFFVNVEGSHYRYGTMQWQRRVKPGNTDKLQALYYYFRVITGWESDYHDPIFADAKGKPAGYCWDDFSHPLATDHFVMNYGDGNWRYWSPAVVTTSLTRRAPNNCSCKVMRQELRLGTLGKLFIECKFYHEYAKRSQYDAYFTTCCRMGWDGDGRVPSPGSELYNNNNWPFRLGIKVIIDDFYTESLVSGFLPVASVPLIRGEDIAYQQFIVTDPHFQDVTFRAANQFENSNHSIIEPNGQLTLYPITLPPGWTIGVTTGLVAWYNATTLRYAPVLYQQQIIGEAKASNRTVPVDFLYTWHIIDKMCVAPGGRYCNGTKLQLCDSDRNCSRNYRNGTLACQGTCEYPAVPAIIPPTPPLGSLITIYATQTAVIPVIGNRTGPGCCYPGEVVFLEEGPFPEGFGDEQQGLRKQWGINPVNVHYTWTPTYDQAGVYVLCWASCAIPRFNFNESKWQICSAPYCFSILVSLKRNTPPIIYLPEESKTELGVIAYHQTAKYFVDLTVDDDAGPNDVEVHIDVDRGWMEAGSFPPGLQFLNNTNGTRTKFMFMKGTIDEINQAFYKLKYVGPEGITLVRVWISDRGFLGIGNNEPYTAYEDFKTFKITILPACNNPCSPSNTVLLTAIYESLKGPTWIRKDNWLVGDPCWDNWYGVHCWGDQVKTISLPENNLQGSIPCEMWCLKHLQELWLMNNLIGGQLHPKMAELQCLYDLGLGYNKIGWTLPPEIATMKSLRFLQLHNNLLIGTIPVQWGYGFPQLEQIQLQNNLLKGVVPGTLWNLALDWMWLDDNALENTPPTWSVKTFYREDELERVGFENKW